MFQILDSQSFVVDQAGRIISHSGSDAAADGGHRRHTGLHDELMLFGKCWK